MLSSWAGHGLVRPVQQVSCRGGSCLAFSPSEWLLPKTKDGRSHWKMSVLRIPHLREQDTSAVPLGGYTGPPGVGGGVEDGTLAQGMQRMEPRASAC